MSAHLLRFRVLSLAEGASYLLLLFVAMPLKYLMGLPQAVRVVGMLHGLLFVALLLALVPLLWRGWRLRRALKALALALVPFGALWLEAELRREARASP